MSKTEQRPDGEGLGRADEEGKQEDENPVVVSQMTAINKAFYEYLSFYTKLAKRVGGVQLPTEYQCYVDRFSSPKTALEKLDCEEAKVKEMGAALRERHRTLEAERRSEAKLGKGDGGQSKVAMGRGEENQAGEDGQGNQAGKDGQGSPGTAQRDQGNQALEDGKGTTRNGKKQKPQRIYPNDPHPENVWLEFDPKDSDWHALGTAWSYTCNHPAMANMKIGSRKVTPPGWLINLSSGQINSVHTMKDYLTSFRRQNDFTQVVEDLQGYVLELGVPGVTMPEITRALRYCPDTKEGGLDYRVFLLAVGDFGYASRRQAIRPYPRKFEIRDDQDDAEFSKNSSEFDTELAQMFETEEGEDEEFYDDTYTAFMKNEKKDMEEQMEKEEKKQAALEVKQQTIQKNISDGDQPLTAAKNAEKQIKSLESKAEEQERMKDPNTYSPRQQVAWSGLFLGEMFDSMDLITKLATKAHAGVPHKVAPRNEYLYKQWRLEQTEKEATAKSPYLQPLAFVSNRTVQEFSEGCKKTCRNCNPASKVKFDHWIMDLPLEGEGRVVVTENRYRIRQILDYVFFKSGSALCLLPHVELMLHFAQNLTDQILGRRSKDAGACGEPGGVNEPQRKKSKDGAGEAAPGASASKTQQLPEMRKPGTFVKSDIRCEPEPPKERTVDQICKTEVYPPRGLPEKFQNKWIRKYADSLFRKPNDRDLRPEQSILPYRVIEPMRRKIAKLHGEEWEGYNCRRFHFRQALWDQLQSQDFTSMLQRERFSAAFSALLPPETSQPRSLLKTNVEASLNRS